MKITICSKNPVKILATKEAFSLYYTNLEFESIEVNDFKGILRQPLTQKETLMSALQRIKVARKMTKSDFYVSLEGGLGQDSLGSFLTWYVCIENKIGKQSIAGGGRMPLPKIIYKTLREDPTRELGEIMDVLIGEENIKQKGGSTAVFTGNKVLRKDVFKRDIIIALIPYTSIIFQDIEKRTRI